MTFVGSNNFCKTKLTQNILIYRYVEISKEPMKFRAYIPFSSESSSRPVRSREFFQDLAKTVVRRRLKFARASSCFSVERTRERGELHKVRKLRENEAGGYRIIASGRTSWPLPIRRCRNRPTVNWAHLGQWSTVNGRPRPRAPFTRMLLLYVKCFFISYICQIIYAQEAYFARAPWTRILPNRE